MYSDVLNIYVPFIYQYFYTKFFREYSSKCTSYFKAPCTYDDTWRR